MKKLRTIITIFFLSLILCGMTSCEVERHSEGRHRGWFQKHDDNEHRRGNVIVIEKKNQERHSDDDHH